MHSPSPPCETPIYSPERRRQMVRRSPLMGRASTWHIKIAIFATTRQRGRTLCQSTVVDRNRKHIGMGVGRRRHLELRSAVRSTARGHRRGEMVTASKRCSQNTVHPSAGPLGRANWGRCKGVRINKQRVMHESGYKIGTSRRRSMQDERLGYEGMHALTQEGMALVWPSNRRGATRQADKCELTRALDCSRMQRAYEVSYSGPPVQERTTVHCIMGGLVLRRTKPQTMTKRPFARKRGAFVSV